MLMFRKGLTPAVNYSLARLNANTMFMDFKLTLRFQFAFFFFLLAYIHCQAFNYYFSFSSVDTPCVYFEVNSTRGGQNNPCQFSSFVDI